MPHTSQLSNPLFLSNLWLGARALKVFGREACLPIQGTQKKWLMYEEQQGPIWSTHPFWIERPWCETFINITGTEEMHWPMNHHVASGSLMVLKFYSMGIASYRATLDNWNCCLLVSNPGTVCSLLGNINDKSKWQVGATSGMTNQCRCKNNNLQNAKNKSSKNHRTQLQFASKTTASDQQCLSFLFFWKVLMQSNIT